MNRRLWIGAGAGAAALAGGALLAADRAGRRLPVGHVTEGGLELGQPPGAVWEVLTDIDLYPAWRPGLTHVERLPAGAGGRPRWREYDRHGHTTYEVVASEAPYRLVTGIADAEPPHGGTWTYRLAPAGPGCSLTVTERGEVRRPVDRAVARYLTGEAAGVHRYLGALAHRMAG
ncbi:SRPBCC family protein [Kitasatospora sp. NPDC089797]|uniref:SRPBCC family protein n=1 Tax=Kitasatospora sp. NPDC089797 TaxID=3155298 RepID=UPI00341C6FDB